jgi:SSS family solute:Na+ symporter
VSGHTQTLVVVGIYLTLMVAIGVATRERVHRASDFLIAGRKLGAIMTAASLAALQIGAGVVLGGAEMAAQHGFWPGTWFGIGAGAGLILAGWLVGPRLHRSMGFVPMDFFAHRYGESRRVRLWAWVSNIPSLLGILVVQLMAAGSVMTSFGVPRPLGVMIAALVVLLYSALSGMWGSVATDVVQLALKVVSLPVVAVLAGAKARLDPAATLSSALVPPGMGARAAYIILPFLFSISVSYDAFMRFQCARTPEAARRGAIGGGVVILFASAATAWIGTAGRVLFPSVEPGAVFGRVMQDLLPPVLAGVVLSAVLAAAMSCANSLAMSLAGTFTRDFYNSVLNPGVALDDLPRATLLARAVVVGSLIVAALLAIQQSGILTTMILFNVPYMASMLVPLLGGALWPRANARGARWAIAVGAAGGGAVFVVGIAGLEKSLFPVDLGLMAVWGASLFAFVVGSSLGLPPGDVRSSVRG